MDVGIFAPWTYCSWAVNAIWAFYIWTFCIRLGKVKMNFTLLWVLQKKLILDKTSYISNKYMYNSSHREHKGHNGRFRLSCRQQWRAAVHSWRSEADPHGVSGSSKPSREETPVLDQSGNNNTCYLLFSVRNLCYCVSDFTVHGLVHMSEYPLIGLYMRCMASVCFILNIKIEISQ